MPVQQVSPVTCPNCRTQFTAPIENIIDGQDLGMKGAFLQGQLNLIQCPQCGFTGAAGVPVLYYDLEKELAFVHVPDQLTLMADTQEKIVGDLTNKLFNNLPQEQRKFYLLNPKSFLTLDSMVKAIYEADGITEEMLQAQEARMTLLEDLLQSPDEKTLKEKVRANDDKLDREFFELLTAYMQAAEMMGDQTQSQTFLTLRTLISRWSSTGKEYVAEIDQELGIIVLKNQEEMLERLQNAASEEEFQALVTAGFPMLDYGFFQNLTAKIDQADAVTGKSLRELRAKILAAKEKLEAQNQVELENANKVLETIIKSSNPVSAIEKNLDKINEAFFFILQAHIDEAQRQGREQVVQNLQTLGNIAAQMLREKLDQQQPEQPPQETPKIHIASR
jgi:hypothetical protein